MRRSPPRTGGVGEAEGVIVGVDDLIELRQQAAAAALPRRQMAHSPRAGTVGSRFRGRGMDFQESRVYQPGDDIRTMDWRVTARTGRPHTKLYTEERERPVFCLVDFSPSMFFGSRRMFKSVAAAKLAALIAWATVAGGDRVGGFLFGGGEHLEFPPRGGRRGVLPLLQGLAWLSQGALAPPAPAPADNPLTEALGRLRRVVRPGSLLFIISDYYQLDATADDHLANLVPHTAIVACQMVDALELAPPPPNSYAIGDGSRCTVIDTTTPMARHRYQHYFTAHHDRIEAQCRRHAIPLWRIATHDDLASMLRRILKGRRR